MGSEHFLLGASWLSGEACGKDRRVFQDHRDAYVLHFKFVCGLGWHPAAAWQTRPGDVRSSAACDLSRLTLGGGQS
eukprot:351025-Chlamydomonas_euryale.AAC.3